jgi:hypothetical protein
MVVPDPLGRPCTIPTEVIVNLSDAAVAQVMMPVDDFDRGIAFYRDVPGVLFLFADPDGASRLR